MAAKKCSKCGEEKPLTEFHKQLECKGGRRPDCKSCFYAAGRARLKPGQHAAYSRAYRIRNPNANKEYYEKNKPVLIRKMVEYNRKNREAYLAKMRAWRKANPEKVQVWVRNRRAKLKGLRGSHTIEDIRALMESQKGRCVYCRCDIRQAFQVDHIVPVSAGGGNDPSNIQLVCRRCNLDKSAQDPLEYQRKLGLLL